ncbi:MAG: 6-phosphogluconolactonase [Thermoleophilia bacterium]|nr:6-phosphogluconolactonase [Thermoleophilia bacterium]
MSDVELRIEDDPAGAVAHELARAAGEGGNVAVSGGSSPRPAYERAAALAPDWSRIDLWWADDRCVPAHDPRSNYRLVRETLLDGLSRPPAVHRVRGELAPDEAAAAYDQEIRGVRLDLALLGIGPDGHTASLFPGSHALEEAERAAVAAGAGLEPFVPRVTLTVPMLSAARFVVFLVTGEDKAVAVARAFEGEPDPATPASLVRSAEGRTVAVLDAAAASRLELK